MTDPKADYAVGYKKPPLHTRFSKGNPGGRPRAARNLKTLLAEALEKRITVAGEDGKRRKISRRELGIARLADRFAEGDRHAIKLLLDLALELERRPPPEPAERPPLDDADRIVIENLLARLRAP
jgi:hypothetical protein